jgi:hypothetical protein
MTRINKCIWHISWGTRWINHLSWSTNIFDEPYQISEIVTIFKVILSNNLKTYSLKKSGFKSWFYENDIVLCKMGLKATRTQTQIRDQHYFGLNIDLTNLRLHVTTMLVKTLQMKGLFNLLSYIIFDEKGWNIFSTYLPIGQIAESERGNKQYFKLDLMYLVIKYMQFLM